MNINATEDELRNITEVLRLASILDDRVARADKARIAAWAEQIHRHNLLRDDLLDGLQAFYDSPSERAIQIGDLIHHARIIKRNRLAKEADEVREERQIAQEAKVAEDLSQFTADVIGRTKNRTPRLVAAEEALQVCTGRRACGPAVAEYLAAKLEADNPGKAKVRAAIGRNS